MKNKGYTLIELLGVMIVLALLIGVTIPTIINFIKNTNEENDKQAVLLIENAAELYIKEYPNKFPKKNGSNYVIEIQDLLDSGNLPKSVKLSKFKIISENYVVAKYSNNKFSYKVKGKNDFYNITGTNNLIMNSNNYGILDYKIYGNSIQNGIPTPETPVEIESVGDKVNLFDKTLFSNLSDFNMSEGTAYKYAYINNLKPNTSYDIKIVRYNDTKHNMVDATLLISGSSFYVGSNGYTVINHSSIDANAAPYTTDNTGRLTIGINITNTTQEELDKIWENTDVYIAETFMIEHVVEYKDKYKIPVKVGSKNLIDVEDTTKSAKGTTVSFFSSNPRTKEGTYTFSFELEASDLVFNNTDPNSAFISYGYSVDGGSVKYASAANKKKYEDNKSDSNYRYSFSFTIDGKLTFFYVYIQSHVTSGTVTLKNAMLTRDNLDLTYEPYVEPVTTNIYLDEPLRKIGDAVDYIDFKEQKVVRNIDKIDLTDTWKYQAAQNRWYTSAFKDLYKVWDSTTTKLNGLSDSYPVLSYSEMNDGETMGLSVYGKNGNTFIRNGSSTQLQPGILYFELKTSKEEKIKLPNIESVEGANILEIDTKIEPSNVEITYYKD